MATGMIMLAAAVFEVVSESLQSALGIRGRRHRVSRSPEGHGSTIVFCEVKARTTAAFGEYSTGFVTLTRAHSGLGTGIAVLGVRVVSLSLEKDVERALRSAWAGVGLEVPDEVTVGAAPDVAEAGRAAARRGGRAAGDG